MDVHQQAHAAVRPVPGRTAFDVRMAGTALRLAGMYNLIWGALLVRYPLAIFHWSSMPEPTYPSLIQCLGMVIGVYGVAYWIAARDPVRFWPIVFVGLLGKILGPIGFLYSATTGELPWSWTWIILLNDVLWWLPFSVALYIAFRQASHTSCGQPEVELETVLREVFGSRGWSLQQLSERGPTMVVFVRHAGCTFCREMLADLAAVRKRALAAGVELAVVHMSSPLSGRRMLDRYGLEGVHHFSDPQCLIYCAFDVPRGTFGQLLSPLMLCRGLITAFFKRHGMGRLEGDGFRMAAVFLIRHGRIIARRLAPRADFHPDYAELLQCAAQGDSITAYAPNVVSPIPQ